MCVDKDETNRKLSKLLKHLIIFQLSQFRFSQLRYVQEGNVEDLQRPFVLPAEVPSKRCLALSQNNFYNRQFLSLRPRKVKGDLTLPGIKLMLALIFLNLEIYDLYFPEHNSQTGIFGLPVIRTQKRQLHNTKN